MTTGKKAGILTFFRPINYGAVLQACAMNRIVLKKLGVDSELIDYRMQRIEIYRKPFSLRRIKRYVGFRNKLIKSIKEIIKIPIIIHQNKLFDSFINDHLIVSSRVYKSPDDLKAYCQDYDAYIVGSDLVWSPLMTDGLDPAFFLDFIESNNRKTIAYAPSVGTTMLTDKQKDVFSKGFNNFDCLSVREYTSAEQLQELTDKPITTVLDPTLLTVMNDWADLYKDKPIFVNDYIFAFTLEDSPVLTNIVNMLAKKYDCEIVATGTKKPYEARRVTYLKHSYGPSEFLNIMKNAKSVVTNSFHGCAFSVIFHKDFYCVPHSTRGIRMIDLLNSLNLEKRIVSSNCFEIMPAIDYSSVDCIKNKLADISYDYLRKALEDF